MKSTKEEKTFKIDTDLSEDQLSKIISTEVLIINGHYFVSKDKAVKLCEGYHAEQVQKDGWISVNDKLPELGAMYAVVQDLKDGEPPISWALSFDAIQKKWYIDNTETEEFGITHWMHLPKPPVKTT